MLTPLPLKVINLWAGPGAGKSTTASGLFHRMKRAGLRVELASEYAKDLVYNEDWVTLKNQIAVLAGQDMRLRRLVGHVDWAITDSPLPLSIVYADKQEYGWWFAEACYRAYGRYINYDFYLRRYKVYHAYGRTQTEDEARALDAKVATVFNRATIDHITRHWEMPGDDLATQFIWETLGLPESER